MAQARPLFDFDLNELPPPEEDGANHVASPAPACEPSPPQDPSPPPSEREPSPQDLPPPPVREPPPSPVPDLEDPLSPLDEDEDDAESQQLPDPPSLPETRSSVSRHCDRTSPRASSLPDDEAERPPSQETSSASRAPTSGPNDTTSSHRPRYWPPRDDAISKRRRAGYDEDAASSYGGSSRAGPPSSCRYEQTGGRLAPATNAEFGGPRPRNRRRRRPERPRGYQNQSYGQDQRMQKGYVSTQQGSSDCRPPYYRRQNQAQAPPRTGGYQQHREAVSFSGGAYGSKGPYGRRQSPVLEPPKTGGYRQHRVAPAFRPQPSRADGHDREDSYGGRSNPAGQEHGPNVNGGYQQTESPRHGGYHHHARDAGAFDGWASTGNQPKHEARPNNYQHRRSNARNKTAGGSVRNHRPYGEVHQK